MKAAGEVSQILEEQRIWSGPYPKPYSLPTSYPAELTPEEPS